MADDENLGKDFKKAVSELTKANKELKSANEKLVERGGLAAAGKEIHKTWTSTWTGMKDTLVGSLGPVGKIGESLVGGMWGKAKQKKEEKLLAKQLGIGEDEMRAMAKQKQILTAQAEAQKKFEAAAEAMGIPEDVWKNTVDRQTQLAEVAVGEMTGNADFASEQQLKRDNARADAKDRDGIDKLKADQARDSKLAKESGQSEEQLTAIKKQQLATLTAAENSLVEEKKKRIGDDTAVEDHFQDIFKKVREDQSLSAIEATAKAKELFETETGLVIARKKTEEEFAKDLKGTMDPELAKQRATELFESQENMADRLVLADSERGKGLTGEALKEEKRRVVAAQEAEKKKKQDALNATSTEQKTVQDFYKELRGEFTVPAGRVADELRVSLTAALETAKQMFAAQEAAAAAKKQTDPTDAAAERIEDSTEAFAAAIAEQAQRSADIPDPKPEVIPTNGKGDLDAKALEEQTRLQEEQKQKLDDLVTAGTKAGSLFVHDTSVEDAIADQAKSGGAAAEEVANEQARHQERFISTLEGIEDNTGDLKGIKKLTDKKGKGFLASLLGGGGLLGGAKSAMASMGAKFLPGGVAGLKAMAPAALKFLKVAGPIGIVIGGVVAAASMVKDGVEGYNKAASGEWPVDKVSGAIGAAIGGTGSGWKNAAKQGLKGAAVGAAVGLAFGPVGAIVGGVVGGAVGGIAGFIGGETISKWVDGATKSVRNIFNIPELLTPEQIAASETRLTEIKTEVSTFDTQIESLKEQLKSGNLTGKDRIDAMNTLTKLEADRDKTLEEQATINRNLSNSNIAEAKAAVDRASEEYNNATRSAKQEKDKLFWLAIRYGKDSDEYKTQKDRYDAAAQWEKDSRVKLEEQKTARDTAQKEHDETNKTMMGNVRLFWGSFKESIPSWEDVKEGAGAFIKDPLGSMRTAFNTFSPIIKIPSWDTVKEGVTGFFKDPAGTISTAFSSFKAKLPDMEAIKNHLPDSLVAAGEWAADKLPLLKAGLAGVALPALNLIKENMPDSLKGIGEWAADKITGLKDKLKDISLPSMATIAASMPDVLTGAGDWAAGKMAEWKAALPEIKLPDVSQVMGDISDMASNAAGKVKGFFKGLFGKGEEAAETDQRAQLDTIEQRRAFFKNATEEEWQKEFDNTKMGDVYSKAKERKQRAWEDDPEAYASEAEMLAAARLAAMNTVLGEKFTVKDTVSTDEAGNEVAESFTEVTNALGHVTTLTQKMVTEAGAGKEGRDISTATSDLIEDEEGNKFMAEMAKEIARPKMDQSLDAAVKAGFYDVDWVGASEIDREALQEGVKSGLIQKEMLDNIIADRDLRASDLQFMKTLVEQATTGESLHVRDKGIHDRLDIITGQDFWRQVSLMNAAVTAPTTNGASMTVVNNTTMAGGETTTVATNISTLIGTTDPHTQIAMAY